MSWIKPHTTELVASEPNGQRRRLASAALMTDGAWRLDAAPGLGLPDRLWEGDRAMLPILVGATPRTRVSEDDVRALLTELAEAVANYLAAQLTAQARLGVVLETLPAKVGQGALDLGVEA